VFDDFAVDRAKGSQRLTRGAWSNPMHDSKPYAVRFSPSLHGCQFHLSFSTSQLSLSPLDPSLLARWHRQHFSSSTPGRLEKHGRTLAPSPPAQQVGKHCRLAESSSSLWLQRRRPGMVWSGGVRLPRRHTGLAQ
jgi:hypothetical protein